MNKIHVILFLLLAPLILVAQEYEAFGGLSINHFFGGKSEGHFEVEYGKGSGKHFGVGISTKAFVDNRYLKMNLFIGYESYQGEIYTKNGSLGSSYSTSAKVKKQMISFLTYPVRFKFFRERLKFEFGPEVSFLLTDELDGRQVFRSILPEYRVTELNNDTKDFSAKSRIALNAKIGFKIEIIENLYVIPQYIFSLGISSEFQDVEANVHNYIDRIGIGISWKMDNTND